MRTEHTRQTRWGHAPEAVNASLIPPGSAYVKEVVWFPCTACDLQVHASYTRALVNGVSCPGCGGRLADPPDPGSPATAAARVLQEEDRFRRRLQNEEI